MHVDENVINMQILWKHGWSRVISGVWSCPIVNHVLPFDSVHANFYIYVVKFIKQEAYSRIILSLELSSTLAVSTNGKRYSELIIFMWIILIWNKLSLRIVTTIISSVVIFNCFQERIILCVIFPIITNKWQMHVLFFSW